jgi:hypothetical protein
MKQPKYTLSLGIAVTLASMFVVPSSLVYATDTTPPVLLTTDLEPTMYIGPLQNSSIICMCSVNDENLQNVKIIINGPNDFLLNESMIRDPYMSDYYTYTTAPLPCYGTYFSYMWAVDTSGNTVRSTDFHTILLAQYLNYVHVDVHNTLGPWNGTAQYPFQTIGDGFKAVRQKGTIFIHNGTYYREGPEIGQVTLLGENQDTVVLTNNYQSMGVTIIQSNVTISDMTFRGYGIGVYVGTGCSHISISNCTFIDNSVGIDTSYDMNLTDMHVYHNNFINNTNHVHLFQGSHVVWNAGVTGNYWDDYRTKYPYATINYTTETWDTPYVISTNNIDSHPWVYQKGIINQPPRTPGVPAGPDTGVPQTTYTYTALTTDIDSALLYYWFDWGDGNNSGWVGPYTSGTLGHASHRWQHQGTYQLKVKAKDQDKQESTWSSALVVSITTQVLQHLIVTAPASVREGQNFHVIVTTTNGSPIENALVSFADENQYTNDSGSALCSAPELPKTTVYSITASKTGYEPSTESITVLHTETQQQNIGWIYGIITDASTHVPIPGVEVSALFSNNAKKVTYADVDGQYVLLLPIGSYSLEVKKQGYTPVTTPTIIVTTNAAVEHSIQLETTKGLPSEASNEEQRIIEYTIQQQVSQGILGGRVDLFPNEKTISYYSDAITLELNTTAATVSFNVSAGDTTTGTILVIHIGNGVLSDLNNVLIIYDGEPINETTDVTTFFIIQNTTTPHWLRFLTTTGLYVFIQVPHFSKHTITIHAIVEVVKGLSSTAALFIYMAIILIVSLVSIAHMKRIWKR